MDRLAKIIVIGNEKGGAGKTTIAMHLIASLLHLKFKIMSVDVDVRQGSLTKYIKNRDEYAKAYNLNIQMPDHYEIKEDYDQEAVKELIQQQVPKNDFIIIDTPGSNSILSQLVHSYADIIITPINDSFIDLDLIAHVDGKNLKISKPGIYSQMVWEQKMKRMKRDQGSIDWIVMRNRIAAVDAHNKRNMEKMMAQLSSRLGCKIAPGFGERVIFRELFLKGLTLLDLKAQGLHFNFSTSHIIARQELLSLINKLNIPIVQKTLAESIL